MAIASLGSLAGSAAWAPPPNTVQYGYASGASLAVSSRSSASSSASSASSTNEAAVEGSVSAASYDVSFSTPLSTLKALGFLEPGDVLTSSGVSIMEQETQASDGQSVSVAHQGGTSSDGTQSSATVATQQTDSEQNVALLVRQNWETPNGVNFVSQVMVRVNLLSQTGAIEGATSSGSNGAASNTSATTPSGVSFDALASLASNIAAASLSSAASAGQTASTSTQVSQQSTPAAVAGTASAGSGMPGVNSLAEAGTSSTAYLIAASQSDGDSTTNSLLALIESIQSGLQTAGAGTDGNTTQTANLAA